MPVRRLASQRQSSQLFFGLLVSAAFIADRASAVSLRHSDSVRVSGAIAGRPGPDNRPEQSHLHNLAVERYLGVKARLEAHAAAAQRASYDDKLVIATIANSQFTNLTLSLFHSMQSVGRDKLLVFCEDAACEESLKAQAQEGIQIVHLGNNMTGQYKYGKEDFNNITALKPSYVLWLLEQGYNVLFTDGDIIWRRDAASDLASRAAQFSFIAQDDSKFEEVPETTAAGSRIPCTGFFYVRPTETGKALMQRWSEIQKGWLDQKFFAKKSYKQHCHGRICSEEVGDCAPESECLILARRQYAQGSVPVSLRENSSIVHANWGCQRTLTSKRPPRVFKALKGVECKVCLFRKWGLWSEDHAWSGAIPVTELPLC